MDETHFGIRPRPAARVLQHARRPEDRLGKLVPHVLDERRCKAREARRERRREQEALQGRDSGKVSNFAKLGRAEGEKGNGLRYGRIARQTTASRPRRFLAAVQAQESASETSRNAKAGSDFGKERSPGLTSAESSQALLPCANVANSSLSPDPSLLHVGSACCLYVLGGCGSQSAFVFAFGSSTKSCDWRATTHGSIGSFVCPDPA